MLPNGKLMKKKPKVFFMFFISVELLVGIIFKCKKKHFDVNETTEGRIIIDCCDTKCVVLIKYFRTI
jgi:hypothetical protein